MLRLSEAQRTAFQRIYEAYLVEELAAHYKFIQPLWNSSAEISSNGSPAVNPNAARAYASLLENDRPAAVKHIIAIEQRLFEELATILSTDQLPRLEVARECRHRSRLLRHQGRLPGIEADLAVLVADLGDRGFDLTTAEPGMLDTLMMQYGSQMHALFDEHLQEQVKLIAQGTVIGADARTNPHGFPPDTPDRIKALRKGLVQNERRILDVNIQFASLVCQVLPAQASNELTRWFNELTYPPVYPDPTDTARLFGLAMAVDALDPKQLKSLQSLREEFGMAQANLCAQMKARYIEWRELHAIEWGNPRNILGDYEKDMRKLQGERLRNCQASKAALLATLNATQASAIEPDIKAFQQRLDSFDFKVDGRLGR